MKIFIPILSLFICFALRLNAQQFTHVGFTGSFNTNSQSNFGGEVDFVHAAPKTPLYGLGIQMLWFQKMRTPYIPLYLNFGYNLTASKSLISPHLNFGYGFYSASNTQNSRITTNGGLYFAGGLLFHSTKIAAPFVDIRFSSFNFSTIGGDQKVPFNVNAITFAAGISIGSKKK